MSKEEAKRILIEMQKWRRAEGIYDEPGVEMPYTPKEFGEAIDYAIDNI